MCVCVFYRRVSSYQNLRTRSFNVFGGEQRFSSTASSSFKPTASFGFCINVKRCRLINPPPPPNSDLTGLPVAFYFNTSELPLSKLKPRLLPPNWPSTQMRQQEVFAVDSRVQPTDVFCVCVRESVCETNVVWSLGRCRPVCCLPWPSLANKFAVQLLK